jgi:predicted component of type VI protein secretion system
VQHAAGGFCVVDLGSTHGTFINGQRLLPHAEVRLQPGDTLVVGASSRTYSLRGLADAQGAPGGHAAASVREAASDDDDDDDDDGEGGGADEGAAARTEKNRLKRKAKWGKFAEKKSLRRLRQIVTQRPLTENEKVAFGAGAGSGCYGPG